MKCPKVSILMPVYNPGDYLEKAVDSLLSQRFGDFELIAIDDGSTDGSREYLEKKAKKDQRIRLLRLEHGGIVNALNRGIEAAKGEYLARMDADDIALPDRLEIQVSVLESSPEVVVLGGGAIAIDPGDRPIFRIKPKTRNDEIVEQLRHGRGSAMIHPSVMIRASAIRGIGGYREGYRHIEDLDLFWRLSKVGELRNMEQLVLCYRQHPNSVNIRFAELQKERTIAWLNEEVHFAEKVTPETISFYRPVSKGQQYADWAAKALNDNYFETAFIYGLRALIRNPLRVTNWKVLLLVFKCYYKRGRKL